MFHVWNINIDILNDPDVVKYCMNYRQIDPINIYVYEG